jgi:DNA polymerase-3 subunit beta
MQVSVLQENLTLALKRVSAAIASKATLPVLSNVLLETGDSELRITATNLELTISTTIGAQVTEHGAITVPARTFADLIGILPPERLDLELDSNTYTLSVKNGSKRKTNVKGISADDFPKMPGIPGDLTGFNAEQFKNMIERTKIAAAKEDNRPILCGVLLKLDHDCLTLAAADGYRLAVHSAAHDAQQ